MVTEVKFVTNQTSYITAKRWDLKTIREQKPDKQGKTPIEVMIEAGVPEAIAKRLQVDIKEWRSLRSVLGGDLESLGLGQ